MKVAYVKVDENNVKSNDILFVFFTETEVDLKFFKGEFLKSVSSLDNVGLIDVEDNTDVVGNFLKYRVNDDRTDIIKRDYITIKDGATELADGATVEIIADGIATKTLTIQKKSGLDDTDMAGTEIINIKPLAPIAVNSLSVTLTDGAGTFTLEAETRKGEVEVVLEDEAKSLYGRKFTVKYI